MDCAEQLEAYLVPVIERRRRHPGEDLISKLCTAEFDRIAMSNRETGTVPAGSPLPSPCS
ncbi:hypothetical protein [Streptomyces luteolifulvus]|jgi:pulcherriminic acid synthase|uniref:hypothetical protein n=1 Tax=Streptomyces luteolifulvus TaxID=2615112 RepID=UPI001CD9E0D8|nr:hypothetical protein [Streptomyces luteolifulvus]